jgi:PEP-CTERM motif-containing protein
VFSNGGNLVKPPSSITALVLLALTGLVPTASASPVTWDLSGVTFTSGASASGSFVYDALTITYSSIDITVSGAAFGNGTYTILDPGFGSSGSEIVAVPSVLADFTGTPVLAFDFASPLTDAGGTIALLANGHGIQQCVDALCGSSFTVDALLAGSVTTSVTSTPEPSSLLLLGSGLLGLMLRRKRLA